MTPISVTILTKNSAKYIKRVLNSLQAFPEVIIYDTGSTDTTMDIAKNFCNVKIIKAPFEGFGPSHNKASEVATYDWILSVDSDEIMTPELENEIFGINLNPKSVYSIRRNNFYNGKWIRWCGWYPDRQYRLYNRNHTSFSNQMVHEGIITENMQHIALKEALEHYPYETIADFINKMQHYSTLFAKQNQGKVSSSIPKAIARGWYTFFKSYFLKRGFLGGAEGFIISSYNAITAFYKYLKLREYNKKNPY